MQVFEACDAAAVIAVQQIPPEAGFAVRHRRPHGPGNPARLRGIVEKPERSEAPSDLGVVGRYVLGPSIFDQMETLEPGAGGELQLTDALAGQIAAGEAVYACRFEGRRFDAGRPAGAIAAAVAVALGAANCAPTSSPTSPPSCKRSSSHAHHDNRVLPAERDRGQPHDPQRPQHHRLRRGAGGPGEHHDFVKQLLEGERPFNSHDGREVVNGATTATQVSAADQLLRRAEEAQRFLEQGAPLFVIGRPNATLAGVIGFEGLDRYSWLPGPAGGGWNPPHLRAAEGKNIRIADDRHPLSGVLREHRRHITYRAVLDPAIATAEREGHVIATGGSNMPIAAEFSVLAGRVVMTPVFANVTGTTRTRLAQALVDAMSEVAAGVVTEDPPLWTRSQALPGSEQIEAELEEAEQEESAAVARTAAVHERLDTLIAHRRLLWATGPAFAAAVREALALLGLEATTAADEGLAVTEGEHTALVEVESAGENVAEWPYVRLQRRLERRLLDEGEQLQGIIVVNGKRTISPTARRQQFTDALRIACENYGYALTTGETLFALVQRALGTEAEGAPFEAAGRRLLHSRGLMTTEQAMGETEEESDASIF